MSDEDVRNSLSMEGYSATDISEAINQSNIKKGIEYDEPPAINAYPPQQGMQSSMLDDDLPIPAPSPSRQEDFSAPQQVSNIPQYIQPQPQQMMLQQQSQYPPAQLDREIINRVVESIIDERWQEIVSNIGDLSIWKSDLDGELSSIKQEMIRMDQRFNNLQRGVLGKVDEYNQNMVNVNTEMKALEKVFEKIIEPLTSNIKELNKITQELKGRK